MTLPKIGAELLISKSARLFCMRGYHNTSIADIANYCKLSKASVYHYFANKRDLAKQVIHYIHTNFKEKIFCWAYNQDLPVEQRVNNFFAVLIDSYKEYRSGCLIGTFGLDLLEVDDELAALIKAHLTEWLKALQSILQACLPVEKAKIAAKEMFCLIQGELFFGRVFAENEQISLQLSHKRLKSFTKDAAVVVE